MTQENSANGLNERRIALLIDADNVSATKIGVIVAELSKYGTAHIRRAYGNWAAPGLKGWTAVLHEFAVRPMQQFSYSSGKNATDMALVIDAMQLLYTQKPDAFCIASSDADFTPLVMELKAAGLEVYGFGESKAALPFVNACTTFLFLDKLDDRPEDPEPTKKTKAPAKTPLPTTAGTVGKKLAQDAKLVSTLRGAISAVMREDGWASMSQVGTAARRQAPVEPRNYGISSFSKLIEATGLFEIERGESGHYFVADKRNRDRAPKP